MSVIFDCLQVKQFNIIGNMCFSFDGFNREGFDLKHHKQMVCDMNLLYIRKVYLQRRSGSLKGQGSFQPACILYVLLQRFEMF